jgi:hypothetical protein
MEKQIVIKERVNKKGEAAVVDALIVAKTTNEKITSFGVRIKRLANQLILF